MHRRSFNRTAAGLVLLSASRLTMANPLPAPSLIAPGTLVCQFQASSRADGQVMLKFSLSNTGPRDLQVLRWGSPFEGGWFSPFLRASTPLGDLNYQGAMRKRGDPSAQDYLLVPAGQTLSAELALGDGYDWPPAKGAHAAGPLRLAAQWQWHDAVVKGAQAVPRPRAQHQGLEQRCNEVTLTAKRQG